MIIYYNGLWLIILFIYKYNEGIGGKFMVNIVEIV